MKAMMKKTAAILMAGALATGMLVGCAQNNTDYATTVVATYGDTPIYLEEANFMARYNQWYNEMYYMGYFGEEMWNQDIGGKTLEPATKEDVMAALGAKGDCQAELLNALKARVENVLEKG